MSLFDWAEDDEFFDEPEGWFSQEDERALMALIDAERDAQLAADIAAVTTYIDSGIAQFERLLENHAAFDAYLAERGESA